MAREAEWRGIHTDISYRYVDPEITEAFEKMDKKEEVEMSGEYTIIVTICPHCCFLNEVIKSNKIGDEMLCTKCNRKFKIKFTKSAIAEPVEGDELYKTERQKVREALKTILDFVKGGEE